MASGTCGEERCVELYDHKQVFFWLNLGSLDALYFVFQHDLH